MEDKNNFTDPAFNDLIVDPLRPIPTEKEEIEEEKQEEQEEQEEIKAEDLIPDPLTELQKQTLDEGNELIPEVANKREAERKALEDRIAERETELEGKITEAEEEEKEVLEEKQNAFEEKIKEINQIGQEATQTFEDYEQAELERVIQKKLEAKRQEVYRKAEIEAEAQLKKFELWLRTYGHKA